MDQVEYMFVAVLVGPKPFLGIRKNVVEFRISTEHSSDHASPQFAQGVVEPQGSKIGRVRVVTLLIQKDSMGVLQTGRCVPCCPHELKQVVNNCDPGLGQGFQYLIIYGVWSRLGAVGELPNTGGHEGALHEVPQGLSCVLHGLGWGVHGVGVQGTLPGLGCLAVGR